MSDIYSWISFEYHLQYYLGCHFECHLGCHFECHLGCHLGCHLECHLECHYIISLYLTLTSLYLTLTSLYSILTSLLYSPEFIYIEQAYISSVLTDDLNFIMKVDAEHIATMLFPIRRYCIKRCASFLGDTLRDIEGHFYRFSRSALVIIASKKTAYIVTDFYLYY